MNNKIKLIIFFLLGILLYYILKIPLIETFPFTEIVDMSRRTDGSRLNLLINSSRTRDRGNELSSLLNTPNAVETIFNDKKNCLMYNWGQYYKDSNGNMNVPYIKETSGGTNSRIIIPDTPINDRDNCEDTYLIIISKFNQDGKISKIRFNNRGTQDFNIHGGSLDRQQSLDAFFNDESDKQMNILKQIFPIMSSQGDFEKNRITDVNPFLSRYKGKNVNNEMDIIDPIYYSDDYSFNENDDQLAPIDDNLNLNINSFVDTTEVPGREHVYDNIITYAIDKTWHYVRYQGWRSNSNPNPNGTLRKLITKVIDTKNDTFVRSGFGTPSGIEKYHYNPNIIIPDGGDKLTKFNEDMKILNQQEHLYAILCVSISGDDGGQCLLIPIHIRGKYDMKLEESDTGDPSWEPSSEQTNSGSKFMYGLNKGLLFKTPDLPPPPSPETPPPFPTTSSDIGNRYPNWTLHDGWRYNMRIPSILDLNSIISDVSGRMNYLFGPQAWGRLPPNHSEMDDNVSNLPDLENMPPADSLDKKLKKIYSIQRIGKIIEYYYQENDPPSGPILTKYFFRTPITMYPSIQNDHNQIIDGGCNWIYLTWLSHDIEDTEKDHPSSPNTLYNENVGNTADPSFGSPRGTRRFGMKHNISDVFRNENVTYVSTYLMTHKYEGNSDTWGGGIDTVNISDYREFSRENGYSNVSLSQHCQTQRSTTGNIQRQRSFGGWDRDLEIRYPIDWGSYYKLTEGEELYLEILRWNEEHPEKDGDGMYFDLDVKPTQYRIPNVSNASEQYGDISSPSEISETNQPHANGRHYSMPQDTDSNSNLIYKYSIKDLLLKIYPPEYINEIQFSNSFDMIEPLYKYSDRDDHPASDRDLTYNTTYAYRNHPDHTWKISDIKFVHKNYQSSYSESDSIHVSEFKTIKLKFKSYVCPNGKPVACRGCDRQIKCQANSCFKGDPYEGRTNYNEYQSDQSDQSPPKETLLYDYNDDKYGFQVRDDNVDDNTDNDGPCVCKDGYEQYVHQIDPIIDHDTNMKRNYIIKCRKKCPFNRYSQSGGECQSCRYVPSLDQTLCINPRESISNTDDTGCPTQDGSDCETCSDNVHMSDKCNNELKKIISNKKCNTQEQCNSVEYCCTPNVSGDVRDLFDQIYKSDSTQSGVTTGGGDDDIPTSLTRQQVEDVIKKADISGRGEYLSKDSIIDRLTFDQDDNISKTDIQPNDDAINVFLNNLPASSDPQGLNIHQFQELL